MAIFAYRALDSEAASIAGTISADTARQARDLLRDRGWTLTDVSPIEESAKPTRLRRRVGLRGQEEVVAFIRELATLLTAGIPLLSALQTLSRQHRRKFHAVVSHLVDRIAAGGSLAEAMAKQPAWFDELCVSIIQVGESTGSLDTALRRLADLREKAMRLRSRVTTALTYPAVVCLMGVAVAIFLMTYVVPSLLNTLTQAGKPLPTVTRIVKTISDLLLHGWWALLGGAIVAGLVTRAVLATEAVRTAVDRISLSLPVLGDLIRKENTSRIAVMLAALLRSGLPFVDALRIIQKTIRNRLFHKALIDYEAAVTAGSDVAGPLGASGVFSPMVVQMLAVGQESGQLEDMLDQLATAYDQEVATATARLTSLIEPLLIVTLAILVGFIAFATILPILEVSNVL